MRIIVSTAMMREAAEVLAPVVNQVMVIGALAVQVVLDGSGVSVTPTRDVDAGLRTEDVEMVVEPNSSGAAARELARSGAYETPRAAELAVRRAAGSLLERLGD